MIRSRSKENDKESNISKNENSSYVKEPPKFTDQQRKTFHDQACEILDILDKSGNGIYDEDRRPGMYQNKNKDDMPESLKKIFNQQNAKNENTEEVDLKKLFSS